MNEKEFVDFIEHNEKLIYSVCFRLCKNHHTAQDLAQEAFLAAFLNLKSCPKENPKAWLCRIATNKSLDFLRSAYARREFADESPYCTANFGVMYIKENLPEQATENLMLQEEIESNITALKQPYKEVAGLCLLADCSVKLAAAHLCRPASTVQTQLRRARLQLQNSCRSLLPAGSPAA